MPNPLDEPLRNAVGDKTAKPLARAFSMRTVGDLLMHYPRRYFQRGQLTGLDELPEGADVTVVAEVRSFKSRKMQGRNGTLQEVSITDGSGYLKLTFFNSHWLEKELQPGVRGIFSGRVGEYKGARQLTHPKHAIFGAEDSVEEPPPDPATDPEGAKRWAETPIPIYPATGTMDTEKIRTAIRLLLPRLDDVEEPIPQAIRSHAKLLGYAEAIRRIHTPTTDAQAYQARRTLTFVEAFVLQSVLLQRRQEALSRPAVPRRAANGGLLERFDASLPFTLTDDQREVGRAIAQDLEAAHPMHRLVQGEVGSGKTLVALRAMLTVAETGGQAALLAPTEVLAVQHYRSIRRSLGPLADALGVTLLTGQMGAAERRRTALRVVTGEARIVIGTHALLSESTQFYDLGLVVIDEQHRFGVEQRDALRAKGSDPHVLVLTATPIPRTVAMTAFGDLDVSTITQLPPGRSPITNRVVALRDNPGHGVKVVATVAAALEAGRQAFVVCPAIGAEEVEEGEEPPGDLDDEQERGPATVLDTLESWRGSHRMQGRRLEALHGRMTVDEKDAVMRAFAAGDVDVLVATTVIEVGVDVPNATVMVVVDADRFGVSQLHQLRGRVGRGQHPGTCLLVTSADAESPARERLDAVAATNDGFELAQVDLELRREGDVLGATQSGGRSSLKLLRVTRDGDIIAEAREVAAALLDTDPGLEAHPALREALARQVDESSRDFLAKS